MTRAVPALNRALDILELFVHQVGLSTADITDQLDLPRTTVHELVATLVGRSYLVPMATQPTRYRLGVRVFQLGGQFAEQVDLVREAQAASEWVAARCDETVHVAVLEGADVCYLAKVDSTHPVRMVSAVGRRLPAHCTAVGKVLLAMLPPDQLHAVLPRRSGRSAADLPAMTEHSISSVAVLRERLGAVRTVGLAYDDCESNEAVRCVAAPVRDHTGQVVAAMSISVPTIRWNGSRKREWAALVREGAARLSEQLGHRAAPNATPAPTAVGGPGARVRSAPGEPAGRGHRRSGEPARSGAQSMARSPKEQP